MAGRFVRAPDRMDSDHEMSDEMGSPDTPVLSGDQQHELDGNSSSSESDMEENQENDVGNSGDESLEAPNSPAGLSEGLEVEHSEANEALPKEESTESNAELKQQIKRLEEAVASLTQAMTKNSNRAVTDADWGVPHDSTDRAECSRSTVKWDHIKPFPNGIPANRMWEEWNRFIENFELAASLTPAASSAQRAKLLFLCLGQELQGIVRAAKLRPALADPDCYSKFTDNITTYLQSMTDTAAEHESFANMYQEAGESAVAYHARLQEKVRLCGYVDQARFVKAQLLKGLRNRELTKMARIYSYDVNFIVQSATREEAFEAETRQPGGAGISAVRRGKWSQPSEARQNRGKGNYHAEKYQQKRYRKSDKRPDAQYNRCFRCDRPSHKSGVSCPALNKTCNGCGEKGHFVATCRKRRVDNVQRDTDRANLSGWTDEEEENKKQVNALSLSDVLVDCSLGSSSLISFLIDSGADANIIGSSDWKLLKREFHRGQADLRPIQPSVGDGLHAYGSNAPIAITAAFRATIIAPETSTPPVEALFYAASAGRRSLLGRSTASDMGLLHVGAFINSCENRNQTQQFPKMPGLRIKFSVDKSVIPVKNAYYNVPAAYREGAQNRLREMELQGIIERVTKAPEWISGLSAVAKGKDDFRLVVNMRGPNKAINREYYRLPLLDEMKVKLHGARFFSKLDLHSAYYHLELDKDSRDLTTFLTETGMFRFTRLMFGVNCAPEIFQREMVRIMEGVENVIIYIDDILIYAATEEELRITVATVLKILRANNLTINTKKCEFDRERIKFLGHELDKDGFHIDKAKVSSIQRFREPATISELRSFLGLASFVSPHVPNFADMTSPLWSSTTSWQWGSEQKAAFDLTKKRIMECTIAQGFFSENDSTILYTDASPVALGAVLVQEDKDRKFRIISFASKALTQTESKYPQNQREALAAVWAVEHFFYFLLGRQFTLRTDAQGVAFILNRSREESKRALNRADGWALRLSPYRFNIEYVRGRDNIADASSRLYRGNDDPFEEECSPWEIAAIEANTLGFLTTTEIIEATSKDETLQTVLESLRTGKWPGHLRKYQLLEGDLTDRDGILVKTGCVVVPEQLRTKALEVAHQGHPSAAKMKSILRQRVWWPGMATDTVKWVETCSTCAVNGRPEKPTPMERTFAPKAVWETVALDFNGPYVQFGGISILAVVDYRSRYLIAKPVKSTSFEHTIAVLEAIFEREGYPANIKTDNGPPFHGKEYKSYCSDRGINTIFSTPLFPQQNGLVEGYMKVINKAMSTASANKTSYVEELRAAVGAHNAATHRVIQIAPEEVMTGRKIKRGLPLLCHENINIDDEVLNRRDREAKLQSKQWEDARRGARPCRVKPGDEVVVERSSRAKGESRFAPTRFTVVEEKNGSLTMTGASGQVLRRHVSHTKKVHPWRNSNDGKSTDAGEKEQQPEENSVPSDDLPSQSAKPPQQSNQQRPARKRKAPEYLEDYVQVVEVIKERD